MIDAIEGIRGYSEPQFWNVLVRVTLDHVFDGLNDESASPYTAVSLAAASICKPFFPPRIRHLSHFEIGSDKRIYQLSNFLPGSTEDYLLPTHPEVDHSLLW